MLKVDLIYSSWKKAPNGASHFVGRMEEMKNLFLQNGVDLRVITPDLFNPRQFDSSKAKPKLSGRIAYWLAKHSIVFTRLVIYLTSEKLAKQVVDYYVSLPDKGDVLAFQETTVCYYYLKKYKYLNKKVLLTIHSNGDLWKMWYYRLPKLKSKIFTAYRNRVENVLFKGCDKIGFVADYPRRYFCEHYPFDANKTYFAYTSIESKEKPPTMIVGEKVRFITSGTLSDRKNQMGVLNAIGLLSPDYQKKISYTLLSDGEAREALKAKAETLDAEIIFTGKVDNVEDYLKQANCFILYSKDEGQPMSIVEAMREGLPIIGSNIAGIPEQIVEEVTGFVVDLDERELAKKLRLIVDNKDKLPAMGRASYELFMQKFTIDAMVRKYADIYKS